MSSTIPPLLCSTPPPIDFDDGGGTNENDDFEPFESTEDGGYDKFDVPSEAVTLHTNTQCQPNTDLPVPECPAFTSISHEIKPSSQIEVDEINRVPDTYLPKTDTIENSNPTVTQVEDRKSISNKDPIELIISEPPPIDIGYSSESQSPKNSRGDSPLSIEFSPGNLSDDDGSIDFQINESRYDDNTSLPSLKFDAINLSKSTTPTLEEKPTIAHKGVGIEDSQPSTTKDNEEISAFVSNGKASIDSKSACDQDLNVEAREWSDGVSFPDCDEVNPTMAACSDDLTQKSQLDLKDEESEQDSYVLQELREDLIKDFGSGEASPLPENILRRDSNGFRPFENFVGNEETEVKTSIPTSNQLASDTTNEEVMFEADFSQAVFTSEQAIDSSTNVKTKTDEKVSDDHHPRVDDLEDDFEDFQDFTTADSTAPRQEDVEVRVNRVLDEEKSNQDSDVDDDFGDFNDFQGGDSHATTDTGVETNRIVNLTKIDDKLRSVLEMMFPVDTSSDDIIQASNNNARKLSNNDLATNLREIDSAKALEYQWLQSSIKTSLVRALGIDSRNILYGEKWNSSMPKFAANLGFNPLEPLKPTKLTEAASTLQHSKSSSSSFTEKMTTASSTADVPAVKFDWNSSGLVNPLDGVKEILHERKTETIHPTQFDESNGSSGATPNDKDTAATNEQTSIDYVTSLSGFNNDLNTVQDTKETTASAEPTSITSRGYRPGENYIDSPSTLPTNAKLIPLKETHIYTPSKSEGTISRSVHKSIENGPIDFDYEMAAAGIVINEQVVKKEYRDIVYNPDSKVDGAIDAMPSELSPGSKADTEQHIAVVDPNKSFRHKSKGPDILSGPILSILEKKTDSVSGQSYDPADDFSEFQHSESVHQKEHKLPFAISNDAYSNLYVKYDIVPPISSSVRGNSEKNDSFDDDFTDFQSVLPAASTKIAQPPNYTSDIGPSSRTQTPGLNEEMILSPAVLLPQAIQLQSSEPKINWPSDSEINPEELARLESLFPQAKNKVSQPEPSARPNIPAQNSSPQKEHREDDDWSDFVSVPPTVANDSQMSKGPSMQPVSKVNTISKPYDDDDWSDFVSSAPVSAQTSVQQMSTRQPWSALQLPPPQFSSWNQPSLYNVPPSTGSTGPSFASTSIPNASQHVSNRTVPTIPATNLYQANNYNNHYLLNGHLAQRGASQLQQNHLQYRMPQQLPTNEQVSQHQRNTSTLHSNVNILKSQLNMAPSISLLPDLSFAAPKSLVNLTRTNTSSKK